MARIGKVFKLESQRTNALGETRTEMRYGMTSLPAPIADPNWLLELTRGHWRSVNGSHYRRNATLHKDQAKLRMGHAPETLAVLNNIILGLFARQG